MVAQSKNDTLAIQKRKETNSNVRFSSMLEIDEEQHKDTEYK